MLSVRGLIGNLLLCAIAAVAVMIHGSSASAQLSEVEATFDRITCEPPISTCKFLGPEMSSESADTEPTDTCPPRFSCNCVPSCPQCDDCAAQVCLPDPERECTTACDCDPGLGCFGGRCIAGFAPVFCCDSERCPAGNQCQHRDGSFERCADGDPNDPMCRERVEKISRAINHVVDRFSYCESNDDCTRIPTSTECLGTCGQFVNVESADWARKLIRLLDRKICSDYNEDGCPTAIPLCLLTRPACIENRCVGVAANITPIPLPDPIPLPERDVKATLREAR